MSIETVRLTMTIEIPDDADDSYVYDLIGDVVSPAEDAGWKVKVEW